MVLTASLSAINSDVFGVGRMLHGMAEQGSAPKVFAKTSRRGIPWVTVMVMTIALLFAVYLNYIMPENVFLVIASLATFATVWVWIMILLSQIAFRRRLSPEEVKALKFKSPAGGDHGCRLGVPGVYYRLIGYHPDTRISLYVGMAWIALLLLGWVFKTVVSAAWRRHSNQHRPGQHRATRGGLPTRVLPRYPPPKNPVTMSSAPDGYGKVCPFCTMRIHDVEGMAPSGCTLYQGATGPTVYYPVVER